MQAGKMSQEEKIKMLDEKRDKVIVDVEAYTGGKCKKILLIAQREDDIIIDIPLKGLPNFADEKLLMEEILEANLARRIVMGLQNKIQAMVNSNAAQILPKIEANNKVLEDVNKGLKELIKNV